MGTSKFMGLRAAIVAVGRVEEEDVTDVALHLSSKFPQSGMTLQEIEAEIRRYRVDLADDEPAEKVTEWVTREMRQ